MAIVTLNHARYLMSAAKLEQLPEDKGIEIAFAGRSNAGKSSGLNTISGINKLAKSSKTPGRTQLINLFQLDDNHRLVDLPGYGYAQVPDEIRRRWQETLGLYLQKRQCLLGLILFMDSRHPLQKLDTQMIEWAQHNHLQIHILLTKADKLTFSERLKVLKETEKSLEKYSYEVSLQLFSATSKEGVEKARIKILEWLNQA